MASMTRTTDTPMCDGSRDGSVGCLVCGVALASTRARYCSRAHQQLAFRLRHQSHVDLQHLRQQLQQRRALTARTVYECPNCLRFVSSKSASIGAAKDEELERRSTALDN